jgi:hypothetical protein
MTETITSFGDPDRPAQLVVDPAAIDQPVLADFLRYWRSLRENAALPSYNDFSPKAVKAHLGWVVIADALPDYVDFRYRLVGSYVTRYFLSNGTGQTIREAFGAGDLAESIVDINRQTCIMAAPVRLTGRASVVENVLFPDYDTLYLPFTTTGERADRVINIFTFDLKGCMNARQVEPAALPRSLRVPAAI